MVRFSRSAVSGLQATCCAARLAASHASTATPRLLQGGVLLGRTPSTIRNNPVAAFAAKLLSTLAATKFAMCRMARNTYAGPADPGRLAIRALQPAGRPAVTQGGRRRRQKAHAIDVRIAPMPVIAANAAVLESRHHPKMR